MVKASVESSTGARDCNDRPLESLLWHAKSFIDMVQEGKMHALAAFIGSNVMDSSIEWLSNQDKKANQIK